MHIDFFEYQFPFTHPFTTAKSSYTFRKGLLIRLQKDGVTAWGEAAPLPGFSQETLPEVYSQIHRVHPQLKQLFNIPVSFDDLDHFCGTHKISPSLQFGLFTLHFFYLALRNMSEQHPIQLSDNASIALNAVVDLHPTKFYKQLTQLIKAGFQTIKIKVDDDPQFLSKLNHIRRHHPHLNIRIDANQSWSLKQADNFLNKMEFLHIEYCEEPLARPDAASLHTLTQQTNVPIALDESLINMFSLDTARTIASVLIIKPMMTGIHSFRDELKSIAAAKDCRLIFTSSLEGGIGRLMTAILAAALGSEEAAHGLATGNLLSTDVWRDERFIRKDMFVLPDKKQLNNLMHVVPHKLKLKQINL